VLKVLDVQGLINNSGNIYREVNTYYDHSPELSRRSSGTIQLEDLGSEIWTWFKTAMIQYFSCAPFYEILTSKMSICVE
jgi:hypothetical protein